MGLVDENILAAEDYRQRRLFLMLYADDESDIVLALTKHSNSWFHFAYILHNKDVKPDGSPKEPHYHLVLQLTTNFSLFNVLDWFKEVTHQNAFGELVMDPKKVYEYLTHDNDQTKAQYRKNEIRSDDINYFLGQHVKAEQLIYDIIFNAPKQYLVRTYGREYVINRDAYHKYAQEMWDELSPDEKRRLAEKNVFFTGSLDNFH